MIYWYIMICCQYWHRILILGYHQALLHPMKTFTLLLWYNRTYKHMHTVTYSCTYTVTYMCRSSIEPWYYRYTWVSVTVCLCLCFVRISECVCVTLWSCILLSFKFMVKEMLSGPRSTFGNKCYLQTSIYIIMNYGMVLYTMAISFLTKTTIRTLCMNAYIPMQLALCYGSFQDTGSTPHSIQLIKEQPIHLKKHAS